MQHFSYIILFFSTVNYYAQNNLVVAFDFDSTKVYVKYTDLAGVLKPDNKKFGDQSRLQYKNDTLLLKTYWLDEKQHLDSLEFMLEKELYTLINQKKAVIQHHHQIISSFFTRKAVYEINSRVCFIGLDYIDKISKHVFLTRTLYQRPGCNFGVQF